MPLSSTRRARPTLQMRNSRLAFVLPAAALLLTLAAQPLDAQDSNGDLFRRGPHGQRPQPNQQAVTPQPTPPQPTPQPSTLPPTQPTSPPAPAAASITPAAVTDLHRPPTTRAHVIYTNNLLEVRADNSSLLQILHDISRETRMTITGGVADQRIFGDYGPASPSTVLATLLDGTGTNMLLQQDPVTGAPIELILSQRAGAPPPSSPNGPGFDDSPSPEEVGTPPSPAQPTRDRLQPQPPLSQSQPVVPVPIPQPANNPLGNPANQSPTASTLNTTNSVPMDSLPTPTTAPSPPQGIVDAPNPPPPGSTSNANGTTTATPESIYQQLLQMQKTKPAAPAATTPTPPPSSTPPPQE